MKTINFCGDSYCATDDKLDSWPVLLARLLNYKAMGFGKDGSSYEHAIQTFDEAADATVFCWTEPHRLYHPVKPINTATARDYKDKSNFYAAAHGYYKYLHIEQYHIDRAERDKYWFDNVRLKYYRGKILHLFSFETARYPFKNGVICSRTPLKTIALPGGLDMGYANHLSRENNIKLAESLYKLLT